MLEKAFQKQYKGIIWKIRPDEAANHLVLEVRDPEKKEVFFSCLRTNDGTPAFDELRMEESWFSGLEAVAHRHVFFHGYLTETLPEHRGIIAHRLESGELAWTDYNLVFGQAVAEGILAWNYKSEPRRYLLINPATGEILRTFAADESPWEYTSPLEFKPVHLPQSVQLEKEELEHLPTGTLPTADLLIRDQNRLLAFYVATSYAATEPPSTGTRANGARGPGQDRMNHYLRVTDNRQQIIHQDSLGEDILQRAMDTFFVMGNQLCYVKRKSEILAYLL